MSFVVLVDSSSDLPLELCRQEGIVVIPMAVSIDGKTYNEGIDIFPDEFYPRFSSFKELPKTSQPNPGTLKDAYEAILDQGNEVVAIHLSSGLSSTYNTAQIVRDMCSQPDKIHVIDSLGASLGYGLIALKANEILKKATSWQEAESQILLVRQQMRYVITLDTLEYLVKGGRVSKTAGFLGGLLDVKPILHMTPDGRLEPIAKVRSRKAALRKLFDFLQAEIRNPESQVIGISHSACPEEAQSLAEEIKQTVSVKDIIISDIGCVVGSHTGPGTIALFYQR
ncbi:EDD domain protein, DegV family [Desulfitobacterium dichloroeliminans LMG P-21439]|uniref:EDD domain protein, DegV family n=1 Tax=Desulfitobacterium dichloroeliminans (strain LMG P-21439 / DCA1) TaxID=871963 RepID=L0F658_DESDL|nr:DegV family protein [Desulfitobacterium dichloroeliminans]AGA69324.1 EDD domain protein, DegV family [Desulfitobacterium dichloroeliminans LMG P-21439]